MDAYVREVRFEAKRRTVVDKRAYVGVLFPVAFVPCPTAYHFHSSRDTTTSTGYYLLLFPLVS
jgi:hypothetical protein